MRKTKSAVTEVYGLVGTDASNTNNVISGGNTIKEY